MGAAADIKTPDEQVVRSFLAKWDTGNVFRAQENSLSFLLQHCSANTIMEHVLLKVAALNQFYSTRVYDTYSVAEHILSLGFDQRIAEADISLVADLTPVKSGGKTRRLYSFASKYCSLHAPERFPIYDSFVEKMLVHFKGTGKFSVFKTAELKNYKFFVERLAEFKTAFKLEMFTMRQLDAYLWLAGRTHFSPWPLPP